MENTTENFKKFASQYWGLSIMSNDDYIWRSEDTLETVLQICNGDLSKWYLNLKPLSQITDVDAIELGKLLGLTFPKKYKNYIIGDQSSVEQLELDYLRFKGYALPYMGLISRTTN